MTFFESPRQTPDPEPQVFENPDKIAEETYALRQLMLANGGKSEDSEFVMHPCHLRRMTFWGIPVRFDSTVDPDVILMQRQADP